MEICTHNFIVMQFPRQLHVFGEDRDSAGVYGAQIGVFQYRNQKGLGCLLESSNRISLKTEVRIEILCYLSHQSGERQLVDQQFCCLLVMANFTKCDSSWLVPHGFLDTSSAQLGLCLLSSLDRFLGRFAQIIHGLW